MSLVRVGNLDAIALRLPMPLEGVWTAEVEVDGNEVPTGALSIEVATEAGPPVVFAGTVLEGGAFEGRVRAFIVGGRGGMRRELPPRQYQLAPPRLIAGAIVREVGEAEGDLDGLDAFAPIPRWVRSRGSGGAALRVLCARLGVTWRMRRDGSVRVGPERWQPYAGQPFVLERDGARSWALAAQDAPDLEPGQLFDGRRVGFVVHVLHEGGVLRSEVSFEGAS
jgi:hypothetical protein